MKFELSLKHCVWQQLPAMLCALGGDDKPLSVEYTRLCISQCEATKDSIRHRPVTYHYLGDGQLRRDIDIYVQSGGHIISDLLQEKRRQLKLVRTNELSAESLHRQGTLFANKAKHHDAPYLSFGLHSSDVFIGEQFSLKEWALAASEVRTDMEVLAAFNLHMHPALQAWKDERILAGDSIRSEQKGVLRIGSFSVLQSWCGPFVRELSDCGRCNRQAKQEVQSRKPK